jgi:hypothetical protein
LHTAYPTHLSFQIIYDGPALRECLIKTILDIPERV